MEEALKYYDIAIYYDPECSDHYVNKGIEKILLTLVSTLCKMGRFEEALKYSSEAIEKNPENSENYANKGFFKW